LFKTDYAEAWKISYRSYHTRGILKSNQLI